MKKQDKTKIWTFDVPLYPRKLWVAIGQDTKQIYQKLTLSGARKPALPNAVAVTTSARDKDDYAGILIWIIYTNELTPGVLAHEAMHAVDYVMNDIHNGEHRYEDANETDAYLLEWFVDTANKCFVEYKKKK